MAQRKQHVVLLVGVVLILGLAGYAAFHLFRWSNGGAPGPGRVTIEKVPLAEAPAEVREAAQVLAPSKVGYVIPDGNAAYVIISTGPSGDKISVESATRAGALIDINLKSSSEGDRLIIARLDSPVADTRVVQFKLNGQAGVMPGLVNSHGLPLAALPTTGALVAVSPKPAERLMGATVQVSGYARLYAGTFRVAVFSAGKGRVLGEATAVVAATPAPNWGSFRINVDFEAPPGMTEGVVLIYDEESGAKVAVPVRFGTK